MARSWRDRLGVRGVRLEIQGEGAARALTLSARAVVWLGSAPDCDVVLDAPGVAPRHLSLFIREGKLFARDHSPQGTRMQGQRVHDGLRRLSVPAELELGPYRVRVGLTGPRALDLGRFEAWLSGLGGEASRRSLRAHAWLLLLGGVGLALGLGGALLRSSPLPPGAAAQCGVDRADSAQQARPLATEAVSVVHAVQLLRAGHKAEALAQYRALSARDDSPAPLAVVAELLEYELACPR
jgi:predicted component of type VI protein secretion system